MADSDCIFSNYQQLQDPILVKFGGGKNGKAVGIGDVMVVSRSNPNYNWFLKDVLHIRGVGRRLVSLGELTQNGVRKQTSINYINTQEQQADILTKNLDTKQYFNIRFKMGWKTNLLIGALCSLAVASPTGSDHSNWSPPRFTSLRMESACNHFRELPHWWSSHEEGIVWLCNDHFSRRMPFILKRLSTCLPQA